MGKRPRARPKYLAGKLVEIRTRLGLSQGELFRRLEIDEFSELKRISDYEIGKNEPPLPVLLRYARLVGISTDVLIDDELDLPAKLSNQTKSEGIKRKATAPKHKRR
jgi:transcriptional regulator with XRE-family HTH domain